MISNKIYNRLLLLILSATLSSCSSVTVPKNEFQNLPSLVEIMVLDWSQGNLKLRLTHRNKISRLNNQLSCQLALKDSTSIQLETANIPDMSSYAVETINLSFDPTSANTLVGNTQIPYVLDCFLLSSNFQKEQLIKRAILYLIPGSKQQYR